MKKSALFLLSLVPCIASASDDSPYAGEELRSIKSLSDNEIESLRRGDGMGFAKLAELNHFPGPKHVLALSRALDLSPRQLADTRALYDEMLHDAVALGGKIVEAESELNREFEQGSIGAKSLEAALQEIGRLRAELRYVHLGAHLRQKQLLNPEQVRQYDAMRGYGGEGPGGHNEHEHLRP